jgi:hypothetical protein
MRIHHCLNVRNKNKLASDFAREKMVEGSSDDGLISCVITGAQAMRAPAKMKALDFQTTLHLKVGHL